MFVLSGKGGGAGFLSVKTFLIVPGEENTLVCCLAPTDSIIDIFLYNLFLSYIIYYFFYSHLVVKGVCECVCFL